MPVPTSWLNSFLQQSKVFVFSGVWGARGGGGGGGGGWRCCKQIFMITSWTRYKGCRSWNNIGDVSEKETGLEPQIYCIIGNIS